MGSRILKAKKAKRVVRAVSTEEVPVEERVSVGGGIRVPGAVEEMGVEEVEFRD